MALMTCHECGHQVSTSSQVCPQCGATGKALTGSLPARERRSWRKVALLVAGISVFGALISAVMAPEKGSEASSETSLEGSAKLANNRDKERNVNIVMYAKSLKAVARNPESLEYEQVLTNEDGQLVCFHYRAQNGFGGTNREWVAFSPAGGSTDNATVKMICRDKVMKDVTGILVPLIKAIS